ncbi:hypothetical protein TNCV_1501661 [Trichonephila clavipes]|uniref:Uncharacterized protein n=1 Tax=Trichonephila clavipes TaxID=2585209 RepID=A0A8X6RPH7_TRICX|nr:hypothetical protein TNCV_1501661 [Trichonephila clavipes]
MVLQANDRHTSSHVEFREPRSDYFRQLRAPCRYQYDFALFHPNSEEEHPRGGQRPPISLLLPPTLREDLQLNGYL